MDPYSYLSDFVQFVQFHLIGEKILHFEKKNWIAYIVSVQVGFIGLMRIRRS